MTTRYPALHSPSPATRPLSRERDEPQAARALLGRKRSQAQGRGFFTVAVQGGFDRLGHGRPASRPGHQRDTGVGPFLHVLMCNLARSELSLLIRAWRLPASLPRFSLRSRFRIGREVDHLVTWFRSCSLPLSKIAGGATPAAGDTPAGQTAGSSKRQVSQSLEKAR